MSDTVIKVENLSKQYRIGAREAGYRTFREILVDTARAPFARFSSALSKAQRDKGKCSDSMRHVYPVKHEKYFIGAPSSMQSPLCDEHEGKRMYRFAEQIRGSGLSNFSSKRTKSTPSP